MDDSPYVQTELSIARFGGALEQLDVVDVADLMLFALASDRATGVMIEPTGTLTTVRCEQAEATIELFTLPAAIGDAVAARCGLLAGLELTEDREQVGRIRVAVQQVGPAVEVLVLLRPTSNGLAVELRRISRLARMRSPSLGTSAELAEGMQFGNYRIVGELGRGSQGTVYRAEHVMLQKPVAIKVLHAELARDPARAAQFVMEARATCRARHPSIIDVTDFGTLSDGRGFYVMELVDAQTLHAVLAAQGALPALRALTITREVVDGLRAAAEHGIVHRDVKPANIFVGSDGRVRLGDFGLARTMELPKPNQSVELVGTAYYLAPELVDGAPATTRSDLYSVGCVLYEMVTGKVPYGGRGLWEILEQHATAPPPPIVAPDGALPYGVEDVIRRAMARRPEERYQHAEEMLVDLETVLRGLKRGGWRKWLPT